MIKLELTETYGWQAAIRGMRNPLESWSKMDSVWDVDGFYLGDNDLGLMQRLAKAGDDHGKFLRMLIVYVDITAPLYWWKEFDTYKVGTVANSCSTMHKIHARDLTLDDFSHEHLNLDSLEMLMRLIKGINEYRYEYTQDLNDKDCWWQLIQMLPTSYNQKRTVMLNYQVLKNIYFARKHHKLDEWHTFCEWIGNLPYFKEIFQL